MLAGKESFLIIVLSFLLIDLALGRSIRGEDGSAASKRQLAEKEQKIDKVPDDDQGDLEEFDTDLEGFEFSDNEFQFNDASTGAGAAHGADTESSTNQNQQQQHNDGRLPPSQVDIVIVGGGWSGLAALDSLIADGSYEVLLLEGRDSLGGRSRTIHNFVPGVATELGSAWLYEKTDVAKVAEEVGLPYGRIDYFDNWNYLGLYTAFPPTARKSPEPDAEESDSFELSAEERQDLLREAWERSFVPFSQNRAKSIKDDSSDVPYSTVLDQYFADSTLLTNQTRQFLQSMVHAQVALEFAAPLKDISTLEVGQQVNQCIFCGAFLYTAVPEAKPFEAGFGRIIESFAEPHLESIFTDSRVTKIEYADDPNTPFPEEGEHYPIKVTYTSASETEYTVTAQRVLVTVPLGVLKAQTIEFVPPLPNSKQSAIDELGMGLLNKCILYWNETLIAQKENITVSSWWPEDQAVLTFIPDSTEDAEKDSLTAGLWTTFFNDRYLIPANSKSNVKAPHILTAWTGGEAALYSEANQTDQEIVDTAMNNLRRMFAPQVIPNPTQSLVTRWGQDDLAFGSYSYIPAGIDVEKSKDDLVSPVDDRIFFAGEATSFDYGTTAGAYETGRLAATDILKSLK